MPPADPAAYERLLRDAEVLGAELDPDYRVLAITVQPWSSETPWPVEGDDVRLQLVLYPVGDFAAALRRTSDEGRELLTFQTEQLPSVVQLFGEARPAEEPWPAQRPNRGQWGPRLSLQGTSAAPDGRSRHLLLSLEEEDLRLDLHVTFDAVEVRDAAGQAVPL